jgi:hypothetical protein
MINSILYLRVAGGTLRIPVVEPRARIKTFLMSSCLFKIAHLGGKPVRSRARRFLQPRPQTPQRLLPPF